MTARIAISNKAAMEDVTRQLQAPAALNNPSTFIGDELKHKPTNSLSCQF